MMYFNVIGRKNKTFYVIKYHTSVKKIGDTEQDVSVLMILLPFHSLNFNCHKSNQWFFLPKPFLFFMGTMVRKFIFFFKYIYFIWVKINSERDILLAGAMLVVICMVNRNNFFMVLSWGQLNF